MTSMTQDHTYFIFITDIMYIVTPSLECMHQFNREAAKKVKELF